MRISPIAPGRRASRGTARKRAARAPGAPARRRSGPPAGSCAGRARATRSSATHCANATKIAGMRWKKLETIGDQMETNRKRNAGRSAMRIPRELSRIAVQLCVMWFRRVSRSSEKPFPLFRVSPSTRSCDSKGETGETRVMTESRNGEMKFSW